MTYAELAEALLQTATQWAVDGHEEPAAHPLIASTRIRRALLDRGHNPKRVRVPFPIPSFPGLDEHMREGHSLLIQRAPAGGFVATWWERDIMPSNDPGESPGVMAMGVTDNRCRRLVEEALGAMDEAVDCRYRTRAAMAEVQEGEDG